MIGEMDLYKFSFAVLTAANLALGAVQYHTRNNPAPRSRAGSSPRSPRKLSHEHLENSIFTNPFLSDTEKAARDSPTNIADKEAAWSFQKIFFSVYLLVVAADWLQGPYLYALYKDEKYLAERTVAFLFASGFVSAAISASFVGELADVYGRKQACLVFCGTYSMSCLSMASDSVLVLFVGRVLGGVSTTLMYSVFETWMVHEYHSRNMASTGLILGKVFGLMTTMSSIVAILAGVVGEAVVGWCDTKKAPFMLAIVCLCGAAALIYTQWSENYGNRSSTKEAGVGAGSDIKTIVKDTRIVSLGLISCLFEGSMYLFVFYWSAALKSAHALSSSSSSSAPPFGLIFATFMSAMMFGSQIFTLTSSANNGIPGLNTLSLAIQTHVQYLSTTILLGATSFLLVSALSHNPRREVITLWAFCLFEATVGTYYPSMGYLKGQIVQDAIRGKVYGLLRLPLNIFVVSVLGLTQEGDRHRDGVFLACGGLLVGAYVIAQKYLGQSA